VIEATPMSKEVALQSLSPLICWTWYNNFSR